MDTDVLVAGAGPTGLTLAIDLARRGVPVRVVDATATPFAGSRGDGLQPRTLEVFEDLGVLDEVFASGLPPMPFRVYLDGEFTEQRWLTEPAEPTPATPYPNPWMFPQWRTEEILRTRLAERGVRVEFGTALTGFEPDDRGVTCWLGHQRVRARYLVGADGGRSTVRKQLAVGFLGETDSSLRILAGDVRADGLDHGYGHWFARASDSMRGVGLTPLAGTDTFQLGTELPRDAPETPWLDVVQQILDEHSGTAGIRLRDPSWSTVWRPNIRMAERFRRGRVLLAGDAAHVHPPTGGQGLNTSVQDAYNLGWKLAAALQPGLPEREREALLDSYEQERMPVAASVLGVSTKLLRKHTNGDPDAHRRGTETRQLDLTYRNSPLVRDLRSQPTGVCAGDRAPDAPVLDVAGNRVRLFDLFRGPHATLLAFGADPADAPCLDGQPVHTYRVARTSSPNGSIVDSDGHAYHNYGVAEGTLVLVRPDGHIGQIATA